MKLLLLGLVVLVATSAVKAACVPGSVSSISFFPNNTLTWAEPPNPNNCTINYYVIIVTDNEDNTKYQFQVSNDNLAYTFNNVFDMCQAYTFEVHALTDEWVLGPSNLYTATTSPAENANLTLVIVNATTNATTEQINLTWNLTHLETHRCISYYRVVYWDENNVPKDEYVTEQNFSLKHDIPCSNYSFKVNAIIANPNIEGPISEVVVRSSGKEPSVPSIVSLNASSNTVDMVWKLQSFADNHCTVTALNVYTLGASGNLVTVPIVNNVRDNVKVTITGLVPDYVYTSFANVANEAGTSKNVTITFQTADNSLPNGVQ